MVLLRIYLSPCGSWDRPPAPHPDKNKQKRIDGSIHQLFHITDMFVLVQKKFQMVVLSQY